MGRDQSWLASVETEELLAEAQRRMETCAQQHRQNKNEAGREFSLARGHLEYARMRFGRGLERIR